jgi:hypothetical protein
VDYAVLFRTGTYLVGCLSLLAGTMLFARYVMLDVEGKLRVKKAKAPKAVKPKKLKVKETTANEDTKTSTSPKTAAVASQKPKPVPMLRTDVDPTPRPSPLGSRIVSSANKPAVQRAELMDDDDDDESSPDMASLSRAERKRLKREAKLARRAA